MPRRTPRVTLAVALVALLAGATSIACVGLLATERSFWRSNLAHSATILATTSTITRSNDSMSPWFDPSGRDGDLATDYQCVGWMHTANGSPDGMREPARDQNCAFQVHQGLSGYCLYRHKVTNATRRAMRVYSTTMHRSATFPCSRAPELVTYSARSVQYIHDAAFSIDKNQHDAHEEMIKRSPTASSRSLARGMAMVVHDGVLASAYVSVRTLRETGSTLPVEVWFKRDEVAPSHPLLVDLEAHYGVFLREITDPRATKYFTKLHAVFYSAFDHVLLLDADNFPVQDPSYLFATPEYVATGAIFWPDYWQPRQTTFNVQPTSLVWAILGVDYVDMFEQESGQLLIHRRRHVKALNVLLFYGFSGARVTEELQLAWGDKDLFRFAWLRTGSSFHYIQRLPGAAGLQDPKTKHFCGVTIVQHDPRGEILFLHRNGPKLRAGRDNKLVWTYLQQFRLDAPADRYSISPTRMVKDIKMCWANARPNGEFYAMTPIGKFPFRGIERRMLALAVEAAELEQRLQPNHSR